MRLYFNILWIDDQPEAVRSQRERIDVLLKKEAFRTDVIFVKTIEDARGYLFDDIFIDHVDLILVDYDLGEGTKGDQGIVEIRKKIRYKDIIFYSSRAAALEDMIIKERVQGIFCSNREELPDNVFGVFEALVKKVLDIEHSRGIVMGVTSDIDYCINKCLADIFLKSQEPIRSKILAILKRHTKKKRRDFDIEIKELEEISNLSCFVEKNYTYYASNDKARLLLHSLKENKIISEKIEKIKKYIIETIPKRNTLAHVRVDVAGFSRKLIDKRNNKEFTSEDMKKLRMELLEYQDFFIELSDCMNSQPEKG